MRSSGSSNNNNLLVVQNIVQFRVKVREGRIGEITEILAWYEYINDVILDHLDDEIQSTDRSGVWRYLISFKVGVVSTFLSH